MFSGDKTFSPFDSPQKPLRFVGFNGVLNVFAVRNQLKILQPVIRAVQVLMVYFHPFGDRAYKGLPHCAVDGDLGVFSLLTRAKPDVVISRYVRLNWARGAFACPRLTVLDVERGRDASSKELSYRTQLRTVGEHGFSLVDLTGAKSFPPRNTANIRKIADFVKAFVAANWFPNLHAVNVNTVYVGGQV